MVRFTVEQIRKESRKRNLVSYKSTKSYLQRNTMYARQIWFYTTQKIKNIEPIKCLVRRHHDKVIENAHKRTCQKRKAKNNEFKNYVTGMTEWLRRNPKNDKPIE